ncbi:MAG: PilW family protein [Planctomycetota bacterium]|jgi:prepilin-type N-terminal cleavage/methylation domain-containing protein
MVRPLAPALSSRRGFTLLELLLAMAIFTFLGAMVIFLMRRGLDVFSTGTAGADLQDRELMVLPRIVRDLENIAIPHSLDKPAPPPTEEERMAGVTYTPPPPVWVRVRSTWVKLRDVPEGPLKDVPCFYVAFVTSIGTARGDPLLRAAGDTAGGEAKAFTPAELDKLQEDAVFAATGGLMEICYIAIPEDPLTPSILTLYRGFRAPIGGAESLLLPENLDSVAEVRKRCRVFARGLLHFGITWRRVFARDWVPTIGQVGESDPYVGSLWDSTRAVDKAFPLHVGPDSVGDPSDDVFPRWARVELTLTAPTVVGYGTGDTVLVESVADDQTTLRIQDLSALAGIGPKDRWLKIGHEWMSYATHRLDFSDRSVRVVRHGRGTKATAHSAGAEIYIGLESRQDVRLPVFLDRFAEGGR